MITTEPTEGTEMEARSLRVLRELRGEFSLGTYALAIGAADSFAQNFSRRCFTLGETGLALMNSAVCFISLKKSAKSSVKMNRRVFFTSPRESSRLPSV